MVYASKIVPIIKLDSHFNGIEKQRKKAKSSEKWRQIELFSDI